MDDPQVSFFDLSYSEKIVQRLHAAHEIEGTGIGLATVQRMIARNHGRVWAIGDVDQGATLYLHPQRPGTLRRLVALRLASPEGPGTTIVQLGVTPTITGH